MAQLHPTTDTDFQERQYGFQLPGTPNPNQTDRQGVRQVTVDRQPRITDRRRTTVRQRAFAPGTAEPARRLRTRTAKRASLVRYTPSEQPTPKSTARTNNQKRHIDPAVHVAARARAFTVSLIIFSWTATLYLFVQLPLAVFSLLMMGASVSVEGSWVATAVEFVWDTVGYILGLPTIDISSLFFVGMAGALICGYICLFGALMQYYFALIHALGGEEGGVAKKAGFLAAFVLYAVPGFNLVPWVWLWMVAVTYYPK